MVAERFVALAHGLAEAVLAGLGDEGVALRGVPGDPVEHRADHSAGRHTLLVERGVHRELHHDQLVDRDRRDPLDQPLGALVEVRRVRRLDGESPLGGLRAADAIPGQQQAFGALVTEAVRPQSRRGGHPHTRVGG